MAVIILITDYSQKIKYPLADFEITPDMAILDSDIPQTMTPKLIAYTGMDALTYAIENRSRFSDPLAKEAISMIYDNIITSYNGDVETRGEMHIAQCLAGMAFSNALLGITHSLAHKIGAQYHIPHGCCNAILVHITENLLHFKIDLVIIKALKPLFLKVSRLLFRFN